MNEVIYTLWHLALAAVAGLLLGAWFAARHKGDPKDAPLARLVGVFWEPFTYWFDLRGADGRPSLTKIVWAGGVVVVLYGVVAFGRYEVRGEKYAGLSNGYLLYVLMTLLYTFGRTVFVGAFDKAEAYIAGKFGGAAAMAARQSGAVQRPPEVQ